MFNLFKKKDWQAKINSEHTLAVKAGNNLLASGLAAGLNWPHDCRVGSCGTCRCYLRKGKIKELNDFSYVLTPEELDKGMILACQTALKSDIEVDVELAEGRGQILFSLVVFYLQYGFSRMILWKCKLLWMENCRNM